MLLACQCTVFNTRAGDSNVIIVVSLLLHVNWARWKFDVTNVCHLRISVFEVSSILSLHCAMHIHFSIFYVILPQSTFLH